ncbi:hypothetical protein OAC89_03080 [Deltaproteobacteria bacterium]|nr:hypothetical protein [Deltaproteobacteria bacterium]
MGHERIGTLPRTKRWRAIVDAITTLSSFSSTEVAQLADSTLHNVSGRFLSIYKDKGVQAAFGYLIALATSHLPCSSGLTSPETSLHENPSPARIVKNLRDWVKCHTKSHEYAEIACRAAADTIAGWTRTHSKQHLLFDDSSTAHSIWTQSSNGAGFCEVSRSFFSHFTGRYLKYFLEREASAQLFSIKTREDFTRNLHQHIDQISQHAFETSKITQSFAAGWYNNHARTSRPSDTELEGFLAIAFGKVHEELDREAGE